MSVPSVRPATVEEVFWDLVLEDVTVLRAEFDDLIASAWGSVAGGHAIGWRPATRRRGFGYRRRPGSPGEVAHERAGPMQLRTSERQRSPPTR